MICAPVNKIIDVSFVDGPGNRTAVFLQGCNYRCVYCHNPETIQLCRHCGVCVVECPAGALSIQEGRVVWEEALCAKCDRCIAACPHLASPKVRMMTAADVLARVQKNRPFIRGITTSGGECTLYEDFLLELFQGAHAMGLSCLIDSNGSMDFRAHPALLQVTDGVMLDVKATDAQAYQRITGARCDDILQRAEYLASLGKLTEVRTVCSPDFPCEKTIEDVSRAVAAFQNVGDIHYRIIAYRRFGVREPYRTQLHESEEAYMQKLQEIAVKNGMKHVTVC